MANNVKLIYHKKASENTISLRKMAGILTKKGAPMTGQQLYVWLVDNAYIVDGRSDSGETWLNPEEYSALLSVETRVYLYPDGHTAIVRIIKVTNKGKRYFIDKFVKSEADKAIEEQMSAERCSVRDYVDEILSDKDMLPLSDIAADYDLTTEWLENILHEQQIIQNVNGQWFLCKEHMNKGYTKSETIEESHADGSKKIVVQTKWTQKGRLKIHEVLTGAGYIANMDKENA